MFEIHKILVWNTVIFSNISKPISTLDHLRLDWYVLWNNYNDIFYEKSKTSTD